MFDFAWSEIMLIGVVALIAIGPKDLPVAMKTIAGLVKKARGMAAEFQTHVDDMMKDTDLAEVRNQINEIRNFDIKGTVERAVDADGTIRQTFNNPIIPDPVTPAAAPGSETSAATDAIAAPADGQPAAEAPAKPPGPEAPAFIPPEYADKCEEPPAFIPPGIRPPGAYYYSSYSSSP